MTAPENPLPSKRPDGIPRRSDVSLLTPAETVIRDAIIAVEAVGADPLLTDAVVLLGQAQGKVADWLEGKKED